MEEDKKLLAEPISTKSSGRFGRWVARLGAIFVGGVMTAVSSGTLATAAALLYGAAEAGAQIHKASN